MFAVKMSHSNGVLHGIQLFLILLDTHFIAIVHQLHNFRFQEIDNCN